jgi:DNA adenine methylase
MYAVSPLRYPGAKWRLEKFVTAILRDNGLLGGHYIEPYAGGASLALSLLFGGHVAKIHLNDLDRSVYAFWRAATEHADELIDRIRTTPVSIDTWHIQREIQRNKRHAPIVDLGFSTFFLNRTNRSGILTAGVIGGKAQSGQWKIDARFNKENLIKRLQRVANHRSQIFVTQMDALKFIERRKEILSEKCFVYLDPPYYVKGQDLYMNAYEPQNHVDVANVVLKNLDNAWMVSYDDVEEIRNLYRGARQQPYVLRYSASKQRSGREMVFLSRSLKIRPAMLRNA